MTEPEIVRERIKGRADSCFKLPQGAGCISLQRSIAETEIEKRKGKIIAEFLCGKCDPELARNNYERKMEEKAKRTNHK